MASGPAPTLIAGPGLLVAVLIGVTVPEARLTTKAVVPSGVIAMASGKLPTVIAGPGSPVAVLIGVTESERKLTT